MSSNRPKSIYKANSSSYSSSRSPSPSLSPQPKRYSRSPTPQAQRMKKFFSSKLFPFDKLDYVLLSLSAYFLLGYFLYSSQIVIEKDNFSEKYPNYYSNLYLTYIELEFLVITIFLFKKFLLSRLKLKFGF